RCETVEYASTRLISFWTSPIVAAMKAVATPTIATIASVCGACPNSAAVRPIMYTPAVTIVAAWMSADTGVGPSIASGSHTYSGIWADLPVAPTNNRSAIVETVPNVVSLPYGTRARAISRKSSVPKWTKASSTPRMKPKSPMRLTMNAFLPASEAVFFSYQNPINRYEHSPTPSQPTNITRKLAPSTRTSMNDANRLRYEK